MSFSGAIARSIDGARYANINTHGLRVTHYPTRDTYTIMRYRQPLKNKRGLGFSFWSNLDPLTAQCRLYDLLNRQSGDCR